MPDGRRVRQALLVAGVVLGGSIGCLPAGGPPTGQRWLSGRTFALLQFAPDAAGAPAAVLLTTPSSGEPAWGDLYQVNDPGPSRPASAAPTLAQGGTLLLSGLSGPGTDCVATDCRLAHDAAGRVLATQVTGGPFELFRLDPTTSTALDLGRETSFAVSPSGSRLLVVDGAGGSATVYEADGQQTVLPDVGYATFVGEDLYGLEANGPSDDSQALQRVPPDGAPQTIASPVAGLQAVTTTDQPFIVLSSTDAAGNFSSSLLDPATLTETPLPGTYQGTSSDGRWLQLWTPAAQTELYERTSGALQPIEVPPYSWVAWRPQHDECWVAAISPGGAPDVQIFQAGGGETTADVAANPMQYAAVADNLGASSFTADGRHWFSAVYDQANRSRVFVGPADDPTAPTFPVNPAGTGSGQYWLLADGRLLVEAFVDDPARNDIYLVDPDSGQARALGTGGHVVTIGPSRALVLLDWVTSAGSGDLTLIDFATGATTLLAENVSTVAPQTRYDPADLSVDPLAPGAVIAFQVHDFIDSPYDGIWVAALP
jgi:hypothetical protein